MINVNTLNNGRIKLSQTVAPNTQTLFTMYDKIPANQPAGFRDSSAGLWTETNLSKLFFSAPNIQIIQNRALFISFFLFKPLPKFKIKLKTKTIFQNQTSIQ